MGSEADTAPVRVAASSSFLTKALWCHCPGQADTVGTRGTKTWPAACPSRLSPPHPSETGIGLRSAELGNWTHFLSVGKCTSGSPTPVSNPLFGELSAHHWLLGAVTILLQTRVTSAAVPTLPLVIAYMGGPAFYLIFISFILLFYCSPYYRPCPFHPRPPNGLIF